MDDYVYRPLDTQAPSIRLLKIRRGDTIRVKCEILHTFISGENTVPYEALSYTWGSTDLVDTIEIDGQKLWITENLYSALQCLRYHDQDRILWIDAICINQSNKEERSQQVLQMGKIFGFATRVIFWLGKPTPEATLLMESLGKLQTMIAALPKRGKRTRLMNLKTLWSRIQQTEGSRNGNWSACRRRGLETLLERPWFTRVWNTSGTAVFASSSSIMDVCPDKHVQYVLDIMPGLADPRSQIGREKDTFLSLFNKFRDSRATDERDRIFALLGMSSESPNHQLLRPDYRKSVHEVVHDLIRYWFEATDTTITEVMDFLVEFNSSKTTYLVPLERETGKREKVRISSLSETFACTRDAAMFRFEDLYIYSKTDFHDLMGMFNSDEIDQLSYRLSILQESCPDAICVTRWQEFARSVRIVIVKQSKEALLLVSMLGLGTVLDFIANGSTENRQKLLDDTMRDAVEKGQLHAVRLLLQHGANINAQGGYYGNALQAAIATDHPEIVQLLLEKGADVNAQGGHYGNVLQTALATNRPEMVQLLLEKGADVNAQGEYHRNALQTALAQDYLDQEVIRLLLEKGADVKAQGEHYGDAIQAAALGGYKQIAQMLRRLSGPSRTQKTVAEKVFCKSRIRWIANHDQSFLSLCTKVTDRAFTMSSSLDIICLPWAPHLDQKDRNSSKHHEDKDCYPSWIRTTSARAAGIKYIAGNRRCVRTSAETLASPLERSLKTYNAWPSTEISELPSSFQLIDGRILHARGLAIDIVEKTAGIARNGIIPKRWFSLDSEGQEVVISNMPSYSFRKTLVAGRVHPSSSLDPFSYWDEELYGRVLSQRGARGDLNVPELIQNLAQSDAAFGSIAGLLQRVISVIWGRALIRTSVYRSLALVPKEVRPGDLICILQRCSVPVVLRPKTRQRPARSQSATRSHKRKRDEHVVHYNPQPHLAWSDYLLEPFGTEYSLIGECYIDGHMGEFPLARRHPGMFLIGCTFDCTCRRCRLDDMKSDMGS